MSIISYKDVGIRAVSACVPRTIIRNIDQTDLCSTKELENAIKTTGIIERRIVDSNTCASDLCYKSAVQLFNEIEINKEEIDVVIFLSQTPDYRQPTTSTILQHRLGLPKSVACFDLNMACSGYVYGLSMAYAYASMTGINKVLLLVGETMSKITSSKDKSTALLFGDAGSATLVEKGKQYGDSFISLNSDGGGADVLKIPAGGFRNMSSADSVLEKQQADGAVRSDEQFFMDGMEVFNFTMTQIPKDIKNLIKKVEIDISSIDRIVFHQANKYMTDFFAKKLKFPIQNVPYSIDKFGNTSGASIPLTIVSEYKDLKSSERILISGFGAGLSWGTMIINNFSECHVCKLIEY